MHSLERIIVLLPWCSSIYLGQAYIVIIWCMLAWILIYGWIVRCSGTLTPKHVHLETEWKFVYTTTSINHSNVSKSTENCKQWFVMTTAKILLTNQCIINNEGGASFTPTPTFCPTGRSKGLPLYKCLQLWLFWLRVSSTRHYYNITLLTEMPQKLKNVVIFKQQYFCL